MRKPLLIVSFVLGAAFFLSGCGDLDDMLDKYTETYQEPAVAISNTYTVDTVAGEDMLRSSYAVEYHTTFCLTAPSGAAKYEWYAEVGENKNGDTLGTIVPLGTKQSLVVYIPASEAEYPPGLKKWSKYKLTLKVTKESGLTYTDSATLSIY